MSRFIDPLPHYRLVSKSPIDVLDIIQLGVESPEQPPLDDAEKELLQDISFSQAGEKVMTKSAIKKANRLARIARKERQRIKEQLRDESAASMDGDGTTSDILSLNPLAKDIKP